MTLTAAQLQGRKIGGSMAAAALGISPYQTPHDAWLALTGRSDNDHDTPATRRGTALEPVVLDLFREATGFRVMPADPDMPPAAHPVHDYMTGNADAIVVDAQGITTFVEAKTVTDWLEHRWGPTGSDEMPADYVAQVTHYLAIMDALMALSGKRVPHAYGAALIGDMQPIETLVDAGHIDAARHLARETCQFRWYRIPRSDELIDALVKAEARLWDHVLHDEPPDAVTIEDCRKRWPRASKNTKPADAHVVDLLRSRSALDEQIKALEAARERIDTEIRSGLGECEAYTNPDGKALCTWRTQSSSRIDVAALRDQMPAVAKQFTTTTETRVFRLNRKTLEGEA